jgi:dihydroorotase (multifunctional complex type)
LIVDLVLVNAKAYLNNTITECSFAINEGAIVKIGKETSMPKFDMKSDLKGLLVLPGIIDAHVHLRDEEKAYKEDFYSGTAAAAAGGITSVLDMPNNAPVTMSATALENRMQLAEKRIIVNVGFYSEFPKNKAEIKEIAEQGAVGFKLYMAEQIGGLDIRSNKAIQEALRIAEKTTVPTATHAEDEQTLKANETKFKNKGENNVNSFLKVHTEDAEIRAISRLLALLKPNSVHLHFCHISSEAGLKIIEKAKASTQTITCETTPHNLLLSSEDLKKIGPLALTMPPVREKLDIEALWNGISNRQIDIIGSDHAPHAFKEKQAESIWDVKAGIPGLETTLPLLFTEIHRRRLTIADLVRLMAENPADIFKLRKKGRLKERNDADFTIVDYKKKYKIDASSFHSKAKFSPFDGWEVQGKPVKTIVAGKLIMEDGEIIAKPGAGHLIRRQ